LQWTRQRRHSLPEKDALSDSDLNVAGGGAYPPFFSKGIVTGAGG
jgi:hypothetical protein